jgi:hypothetical protein
MVPMNRIPIETPAEETEIRFRDCFSVRYIQSAALLCRLGYSIERESGAEGSVTSESALMHEAFILNSILSSVAFLEATINELYSDAVDNAFNSPDERSAAVFHAIAERWKNEKNFDRAPVLAKYQKVLEVTGRDPFPDQDPAFTNVKNLIEARNFLLHYRREWVVLRRGRGTCDPDESRGAAFEKILRHAFSENPLAPRNLPFFPERCLGHGFAEWAVINSLVITDEFFARLGISPPYDGIRKELSTR